MTPHARMPYQDQDDTTMKWLVIFVVVSLLAHVLFISLILMVSRLVPVMKLETPPQTSPKVTLSLMPVPVQPPAPKHIFMPTPEQPNAKPKETLIESDHDTQVASQSKQNRKPDDVMPDVTSKNKHADNLHDSPNSPSKQQPQNATPPAPKQPDQPKPEKLPPQPKPQPVKADKTPPQPDAQQPQPNPANTPTAKVVKPPQVDPNGLPLLPPISAPTLAQQSPQTASQSARAAIPPPMVQATAQDVQGRAGMSGQPTPEAMATDLGKYKAYIYAVVGSHWYPAVNQSFQILPVGMVRIKYTIHSDGTLTDVVVLEGDTPNLQLLKSISQNALVAGAPFHPFTPGMIKELKKAQGPGGGDSYTDDFSFSVY